MEEEKFLEQFSDIDFEQSKRETCGRCGRPSSVCICSCLPSSPISLRRSTLHILQHPNEEHRPLHTVAILKAALDAKSCVTYRGRRFGKQVCPAIHEVVEKENTFLLYPGDDAKNFHDVVKPGDGIHYNIIILDGTWKQAASIYTQNQFLRTLCKVQLQPDHISEYVIRTQPTDNALSTIECAALVLQLTESSTSIKEILLKPLRSLCKFQLDCGAAIHQSKESTLNMSSPK